MNKTTSAMFRAGLLVPLCVWLAFVALPVAWMMATHDGPETFWQCMERVYGEAVSLYTETPATAAAAVSP
ncbi:MAG: hypothetical protein LUE17_17890 [Planctomycetaceae bacterium]|nr:hypothetical protein [Planctomycetaceae bacterium]